VVRSSVLVCAQLVSYVLSVMASSALTGSETLWSAFGSSPER
jgi:hypothetical protein